MTNTPRAAFSPTTESMSISTSPNVTLVAFAKNEGRFLLEWIAYHRLVGVRDFLIYTNDCEDTSPMLLDRLQEMGVVTHVPNPIAPGERPQNKALGRALVHPLVQSANYVLQIDVDEFLCVKAGDGMVTDLIATAPNADVICIQMRFFGDCGLDRLTDGLIIEQLTTASEEDDHLNAIVKSLAKNTNKFSKVTANHMPGFSREAMPRPRVFNCGGQEIAPTSYGDDRFRRVPDAFRSMAYAQLNHYAVRTFADYCAKRHRGTPAGNDQKLTMSYWHARNRNERRDLAIARHVAATKDLMAEWLRDPVLGRCNRRCFEAYDDIVEKSLDIFSRA